MAIQHRAAIVGTPIGHSLSPVLHNAGYAALGMDDWEYGSFDCDAAGLPALVDSLDDTYVGLSVTMPGKFAVLDIANEISARCEDIGSGNTLVRTETGWRADNTDVDGIRAALERLRVDAPSVAAEGSEAVLIGGGGTARTVLWTMAELGCSKVTVINRTDRSEELSPLVTRTGAEFEWLPPTADLRETIERTSVVINTVPVPGTLDLVEACSHAPLFDVIYNPWPTPLAQAARAHGHPVAGGHVMLAHQAFSQFEQFTGFAAPEDSMWAALMDRF
ncbi:shikimate dehydrogenase [Corynebacterium sp. 13CS0277]|uniref:shikimate dehydrogenase n=1 Tax=Corynebacterium sp. 13CS0277 TaxID=2071994 RepID=UPI000D0294E4|nr:shikimate dehydrogenase [Corynebacterium sp. 13CS0277]PRQ11960.1 shikimate dehydrogenase [Corynebacterium sp. 13CS0277]